MTAHPARAALSDLVAAFVLLTRLPLGRLAARARWRGEGVWAYPVAGAAVGLIGGAAFWAAARLGLPPMLAAIAAVAAQVLATGGLHEDGLADTADGLGGGRDRERALAIMRDSRIGTYGVLALAIALGIRVGALSALPGPGAAALALLAAGMLGRGAVTGLLLVLPPARPDGLAASLGPVPLRPAALGMALAALAAFLPHGGRALAGAALAALAVGWLAWRRLGGTTGDVLGAAEQAAECAALAALFIR
ncbi:MAG: adenosylcobinamide-GDP ribazoletransferase [Proteobacteria bacterium]|nr:adenosylcobinamide-GDP ribazoletransferase [Pseudomonadota bacterium]